MRPHSRRVIDIGKGEPDFHTPDHVKEAAYAAIAENFTKYTPQPGIRELREAIAEKLERENRVRVTPGQIVVSCGGKHSVDNVIRLLLKSGDEALMVTPYWFAYPGQVRLAGAAPVLVPAREENGFIPDPADVRRAITNRTRLLIVNSPNNPTGAVYPREILEELGRIALEHDLMVLTDEVYEKLLYDDAEHVSIAGLGDDIAERTITVNSVSKTHAMTGWRIGYAALPGGLAGRVAGIQQLSTSAPCAISQRAALTALTGGQSHIAMMVASYTTRRAFLLKRLSQMPRLRASPPMGAFYCFVNVAGCFGRTGLGHGIQNADDFVSLLENEAGVKAVSGSGFGSDTHVRISFAVAESDLREGLGRVEQLMGS